MPQSVRSTPMPRRGAPTASNSARAAVRCERSRNVTARSAVHVRSSVANVPSIIRTLREVDRAHARPTIASFRLRSDADSKRGAMHLLPAQVERCSNASCGDVAALATGSRARACCWNAERRHVTTLDLGRSVPSGIGVVKVLVCWSSIKGLHARFGGCRLLASTRGWRAASTWSPPGLRCQGPEVRPIVKA